VLLRLLYLPAAVGLCVHRCQAMTLVSVFEKQSLCSKTISLKVQGCFFALVFVDAGLIRMLVEALY